MQVHPHPVTLMDAQSGVTFPSPEKRDFPIDIPRKRNPAHCGEVRTNPSPECLRNAIQNESVLLGSAIVLCAVAVIPIRGALQGSRSVTNKPHIW